MSTLVKKTLSLCLPWFTQRGWDNSYVTQWKVTDYNERMFLHCIRCRVGHQNMRSADFFKQHPKAGNRHVGRTIVKLYDKQQHNQVLKRVGAKGNSITREACQWYWSTYTIAINKTTVDYKPLKSAADCNHENKNNMASSFTCVADMPHRRRFKSTSTEQLDVPTCRRSTVRGRAFPVAGAKMRNGLPSNVTSALSLSVYKNRLKTYLFCRCYETVGLWMTFPFLVIISPPEQWSWQ